MKIDWCLSLISITFLSSNVNLMHVKMIPVAGVSLVDEEIHYSWGAVESSKNNLSI